KEAAAKAASSRASWGPFSSAAPDGRASSSGADASRAARAKPAIAAGAGAARATSIRSSRAAAARRSRMLSTSSFRPPRRDTAFAGRRDQTSCRALLMDHLFVTVVLALELDGGVLDGESIAQDGLGLGEDLVVAATVRALAGHHDVAGERDQPAGDGPDVEVVHRGDARHLGDGRRDLAHRDMPGGPLEEDVQCLAAEPDRAPDDGRRDQEADD